MCLAPRQRGPAKPRAKQTTEAANAAWYNSSVESHADADAAMQMADALARCVEEELDRDALRRHGADARAGGCRDGVDGHVDTAAGAGGSLHARWNRGVEPRRIGVGVYDGAQLA